MGKLLILLLLLGCDSPPRTEPAPSSFRVVTFNTGSAPEMAHDRAPDDGYGQAQADLTDTWYGNGLAWVPVMDDTRAWFAAVDADVVAFQEVFDPGECETIPAEARVGFVCERWAVGEPTVAESVLGPDFDVRCHPGKPDKCVAVNRRFGRFVGELVGEAVPDCGRGARVARAVVERPDGARVTFVSVHGTSGLTVEDQACRAGQMRQVFEDLDGEPGANGTTNVVLGDFNTDPSRFTFDPSAALIAESGFRFISAVGPEAAPTYAGVVNIDHVLSDTLVGSCWSAGLEEPAVTEVLYFDHLPLVCDLGSEGQR